MRPFAEALRENKVIHAYIVHSQDGMDEISPFAKTNVVELKDGKINEFLIDPKDLGIVSKNKENLKGKNAEYNSQKILEIFNGKFDEFSQSVALNVAAGLIVSGKENDFKKAYEKATTHLKSGNVLLHLKKDSISKMKNILEKIIEDKKQFLSAIKKVKSLDSLEKNIKSLNFYNFKDSIQQNKGVSIISEIKKASPSAGVLISNYNHVNIAKMYIDNGATCLSVLSEEKYFLGKLDHILDIKKEFEIPILAKDFFIDPYQIALSKSYGCDCILIIIAALDKNQADEIYSEALKHNLSVIVEVHDQKEAEAALKYDKALIGINNRNLKTLKVSINNTLSIFEVIKSHKGPVLSESGIKNERCKIYLRKNRN